jgi:hypothetical protein
MRYPIILPLAALLLGLAITAPAPAADRAVPTQEAWQTVCYYVTEPMWIPGVGWHLVYAKRCINHIAQT